MRSASLTKPGRELIEEMIHDGVEFREPARLGGLPMPWKKKLTADQVFETLGTRAILCLLPSGFGVTLKDLESLTAAAVFEKKLPATALPRPELATGLGQMSEAGWLFNDADGRQVGAAEAYCQMRQGEAIWAEHPHDTLLLREDSVPDLGRQAQTPIFRLEKMGLRYLDGAGNPVEWSSPHARLTVGQDEFPTCNPALLEQLLLGLGGDVSWAARLGASMGDYSPEEARRRADWIGSITQGEPSYLRGRVGKAILPLPELSSEGARAVAKRFAAECESADGPDLDARMDLRYVQQSFEKLADDLARAEVGKLARPGSSGGLLETPSAISLGGVVLAKRLS